MPPPGVVACRTAPRTPPEARMGQRPPDGVVPGPPMDRVEGVLGQVMRPQGMEQQAIKD